jgi:hypothetical protein
MFESNADLATMR